MSVAENLARVRERIERAAVRAGRDPSEVTLVAVSKTQPPEAIRQAYDAGQRCFGENYVQELAAKRAALGHLDDLQWHFIGHLQRNKVKTVVGTVALIETVDSVRLVEEIEKRALALGLTADVLIEVNIGDEATKSGCRVDDLAEVLEASRRSAAVVPRGLMVIPPFELDAEETRPYFEALRKLRERHGGETVLPHLSMGMSHDFETAIEEGATFVRVGTAIFGDRP